jgi:hypothetical protein
MTEKLFMNLPPYVMAACYAQNLDLQFRAYCTLKAYDSQYQNGSGRFTLTVAVRVLMEVAAAAGCPISRASAYHYLDTSPFWAKAPHALYLKKWEKVSNAITPTAYERVVRVDSSVLWASKTAHLAVTYHAIQADLQERKGAIARARISEDYFQTTARSTRRWCASWRETVGMTAEEPQFVIWLGNERLRVLLLDEDDTYPEWVFKRNAQGELLCEKQIPNRCRLDFSYNPFLTERINFSLRFQPPKRTEPNEVKVHGAVALSPYRANQVNQYCFI